MCNHPWRYSLVHRLTRRPVCLTSTWRSKCWIDMKHILHSIQITWPGCWIMWQKTWRRRPNWDANFLSHPLHVKTDLCLVCIHKWLSIDITLRPQWGHFRGSSSTSEADVVDSPSSPLDTFWGDGITGSRYWPGKAGEHWGMGKCMGSSRYRGFLPRKL